MVQIIPPSPLAMQKSKIGEALGLGIGQRVAKQQQQQQQSRLANLLFPDQEKQLSSLPLDAQLKAAQLLQQQQEAAQKQAIQKERSQLMQSIFGVGSDENVVDPGIQSQPTPQRELQNLTDEQVALVGMYDPQFARILQSQQKEKMKSQLAEREYQTRFSQELERKAETMRESLPRKESALDFARGAIETGEVGAFSMNRLADALPGPIGDALRTAKGAQLITAGKENLLSNMSRVSARAQNLWFEQRLNSMFPKIGQTKEANLTTQEMLENELAMDQAYLNTFDKLAEEDQKTFGYVRKDIGKKVENAVKPLRNNIFERAVYRMKEIEEREKGLSKMKNSIGKKVVRGTPLTLTMAKLYKNKFGDQALKLAEENGYKIPTIEEFQIFQMNQREFRENFLNE
jgi:hypothetical protein